MSRDLRTAALAAACVIAFAPAALAQSGSSYESSGPGLPGAAAKTTTVKSSKSNTSDRMGGGGGVKGAGSAKARSVMSSKSNTSDRTGQTTGSGVDRQGY